MKKPGQAELDRNSRPPLQRMLRIHQSISSGKFPNAFTLAREVEVSDKTIRRDLEFMRGQLGLPIEYDERRWGYYYSQEVKAFPAMQITEGEILALVIAEKAIKQYRGTHFEKPLLSAISKIEQALPESFSMSLTDIDRAISFRTRAEPILDLELFNELATATAGRMQLQLSYRKPGAPKPETRIVDPYHLANINGEWYLFAFDHLRNDIRTFVPARIKALRRTGKSFPKPEKFSLDQRLRGSFGVHSSQGDYDVRIRFSPRVADFIREKRWHDSQELTARKDGSLDLRLKLSSLNEVERWVLSWGGDARVLGPAELGKAVRAAAERMLK